MAKHVAVYVRVSSKQQDTKSQEVDLRKWASTQDGEIVWYSDKATGKTMERPGWQRLEAAILAGEVSMVVVWRLDRLGRTAKGLTALFSMLAERKVNLFSLKDCLDLSTPAGRLMANVLASVAQYETEVRGERVAAGQAVARAAGKRWGGGTKGKRIKVTETQINVIRTLHAAGTKIAEIARSVGLSRPTVYGVIKS
jgi:DNA invertase Pin-like site-specific DNA recombinase